MRKSLRLFTDVLLSTIVLAAMPINSLAFKTSTNDSSTSNSISIEADLSEFDLTK